MASTTANPLWDIWRRRTYSRPDFTGIDWSGYTPQMNTPMADPGLVAGNARVASGTTIPQTSGAAGSSKWKKVIEQLGKMTGPEPDWSLSPQKMGVPSPWSPTNVSWSAVGRPNNEFGVGRTMLDWKKKKGPY